MVDDQGKEVAGAAAERTAESASVTVQIDLSAQPSPPLVGYADRCAVLDRGYFLEFVFFESPAAGRARVIVRFVMSIDDLLGRFWPMSEGFFRELQSLFEKAGISVPPVATKAPPAGDVNAVLSNLAHVSRAGLDGLLDCYFVTTRSLHRARTLGTPPEIQPLFAIQVPAPLLVGMFAQIEKMLKELRTRMRVS